MTDKNAAILLALRALLDGAISLKGFLGIVARIDESGKVAGRTVSEIIEGLLKGS